MRRIGWMAGWMAGLAAALACCCLLLPAAGCTDAKWAKIGGYGDEFLVTLYACDGSVIREWTSTGKVKSEETSDGYYFMDKATGRLIEVTGTLIIERMTK